MKWDIPRGGYLQTISDLYGVGDNDVIDCAQSVDDLWKKFQLVGLHGYCWRGPTEGYDYVFLNLGKMVFSKLSEKPGLFLALLDSIKQELSKRQGRGIVGGPAASLIEYQGGEDGPMQPAASRRQRSSSDHGSLGHVSRRSRH
jgi:hypothetical protein